MHLIINHIINSLTSYISEHILYQYKYTLTKYWQISQAYQIILVMQIIFQKQYSKPYVPRQQFTEWLEILLSTTLLCLSPVLANNNSQPQLRVCNDAPWWVRAFLSVSLISIFLCLAISNLILPVSSLLHCPQQNALISLKKETFSTGCTKHFFFKFALQETGERLTFSSCTGDYFQGFFTLICKAIIGK